MQERLPELNQELERRYGSVLALRIGVNTGQVVAGDASTRETFVSGDAVNTAARLEQAAAPGEVLLGEATYRLVRDVVEAEPVEPITAKGKTEPVAAYRLLSVPLAPAPRPGRQTPLVGRTEELRALEEMFARATAWGRLELATLIGEPGVGKSRLASEFVAALGGRARVLMGRCLAYGESITWWPLAEIVRAAAGIHDEHDRAHALDRLNGLGLEPSATATLADLFGLGERPLGVKQIPWATRTLIESLAAERPLLLLVEDLHWAEPALLDLLLDLAERVRAPALLLATARPELMQPRPDWPGTVRLDVLSEGETRVLLDATSLSGGERDAALRACGGNPLFAEELASFLAERPDAGTVPPTLGALLAARLDGLPASERSAAERGAVEGELFHRGAVVALSDGGERAAVPAALDGLADRDLARPAQAGFVDEAAFRFKHALVRDAAYEGTAKRLRAELHERFADWLEEKIGDRQAEVEEILGHHLERAYRYRAELAKLDERAAELARRAAERLARAGGRALLRSDMPAAVSLLGRAADLLASGGDARAGVLFDLADALMAVGRLSDAASTLEDAARSAWESRDAAAEWRVRIALARLGVGIDPEADLADARALAGRALPALEGDEGGLADACCLLATVEHREGHGGEWQAALERALEHARRAGDLRREKDIVVDLGDALLHGPATVAELHALVEWQLEWGGAIGNRFLEVDGHLGLAYVYPMLGRFDEARREVAHAKLAFEELGAGVWDRIEAAWAGGTLERLAGRPDAAEPEFRFVYDLYRRLGRTTGRFATITAELADALCAQGRDEEALAFMEESAAAAGASDVVPEGLRRSVEAKLHSRRGASEQAVATALEAVRLLDTTDFLNARGRARCDLAEVLVLADRPDEAGPIFQEAGRLFEQKGNLVSGERARSLADARS